MVRNRKKLTQFYNQEALHREAVSLGIINSKNILDGIEVDLRIARAIHSLTSD